jgi:hypothetical protein
MSDAQTDARVAWLERENRELTARLASIARALDGRGIEDYPAYCALWTARGGLELVNCDVCGRLVHEDDCHITDETARCEPSCSDVKEVVP